ncbi:MAG: hypothetical protein AABY32_05345 [Nanoarchaeota archaeon]
MSEKGKEHKRKGQASEKELHQYAIKAGLSHFINSNPNLKNYAVLISNNIDYNKIGNFIKAAKEKYEGNNKEIYNSLANYVASGSALKDTTIKTLFEESHEGKLDRNVLEKIVDFFKPNKFEGEKYFEKARNAYGDMYDILSQDKVAQEEIPELTKAAKAMKMYGFLDIALKNFKAHGMMDDKMYNMLSKELYKKTTIKSEEGRKGLENYILSKEEREEKKEVPQKIAASIMGLFGILLIAFNSRITGAVIGNPEAGLSGFIGVLILFASFGLFLRAGKRNFKN